VSVLSREELRAALAAAPPLVEGLDLQGIERYERTLTVLIGLNGLTWGLLTGIGFNGHDPFVDFYTVSMLVGMTGGGTPSLSAIPRVLRVYLCAALIPFIAPVLAIPEVLAIYRVHGANSHYTSDREVPIETRKSKLRMWQTVIAAMRKWLAENGYTRKLAPVRAMQDHWTIILEREEFAVAAPGRLRFFRYLLRCYRHQFPLMTWQLRLINGFNALASLVVGYEGFPRLDEYRESLTRWVRRGTPARRA